MNEGGGGEEYVGECGGEVGVGGGGGAILERRGRRRFLRRCV